jgi:hypothetical protein
VLVDVWALATGGFLTLVDPSGVVNLVSVGHIETVRELSEP